MTSPLLVTKLYIPSRRPDLIPRTHLIKRLDDGLHRKLTLISAPAGFGKTTLAAEWLNQLQNEIGKGNRTGLQLAWLSLDAGDNDLGRFLAYLITAVKRLEEVDDAFGDGVLGMLQSSPLPPNRILLAPLINQLAELTSRILLVLDDYHLIDAQSIHDSLDFLIKNSPPTIHLVIATREDPPLRLPRLRARGQATEIRAVDLRFNYAEAAEFLNQVMGLELSEADISAMESRTEGWIAGLQLAAVSIAGQPDRSNLIQSFSGSHRLVLDYLIEEVLNQQSEDVHNFLLQTAILDRFTGALCDSLTGQTNGQDILEMLDRRNLFMVPLDGERCWYRYHHLFTDLLRQRLSRIQPEQIPVLHKRASMWLSEHGFMDEAVDHALKSKDFQYAARLIEVQAESIWSQGEHIKLGRWLDELPEDVLYMKPTSSILKARYQCTSGQISEAECTLDSVERLIESSTIKAPDEGDQELPILREYEIDELRGRVEVSRALISSFQGDIIGIIQHGETALDFLPEHDLIWRGVAENLLGNAHGFIGDMNAAYEARFNALKACLAAGDIYLILTANLQLAITLREQGKLQAVIDICQQQMQFAKGNGMSETRLVGYLLSIWGETLAEMNVLDEAFEKVTRGTFLTVRSGDMQMIGWSYMCSTRVLFSRRDWKAAEEGLQDMGKYTRETQVPPWIASQMAAWKVRVSLAQGNLYHAVRWEEELELTLNLQDLTPKAVNFFSLFDYLVFARILMVEAKLDEALKLLSMLLEAAETGGRTSKVIEIIILQALTLKAQGANEKALSCLEVALSLAEPAGFFRIFVDEGQPMAGMLYETLIREIAPEYVSSLLAAFTVEETGDPDPLDTGTNQNDLIEPLTEREIEVLRLIAEGFSNQAIAARLYVSLNTVKAHTRSIYSKLDVHSRVSAVARGRTLGIV